MRLAPMIFVSLKWTVIFDRDQSMMIPVLFAGPRDAATYAKRNGCEVVGYDHSARIVYVDDKKIGY